MRELLLLLLLRGVPLRQRREGRKRPRRARLCLRPLLRDPTLRRRLSRACVGGGSGEPSTALVRVVRYCGTAAAIAALVALHERRIDVDGWRKPAGGRAAGRP